jgi:hypothetical protein
MFWERICAYRDLVGKPVRKIKRRRPRYRWGDNTEVYIQETGWDYGLDLSDSWRAQEAGFCERSDLKSGSKKMGWNPGATAGLQGTQNGFHPL